MRIGTAYENQKLLHQPVRITEVVHLSEIPPDVIPLSAGKLLYVSPFLNLIAYGSHAQQEAVSGAKHDQDTPPKKISLGDFTKNIAIGGSLAVTPLGVIPLSKHMTEAQLATHLTDYGFTPVASTKMATSALSFADSNLGNLVCLFFAGGAIGIGTAEALKPDWTWKRKILIGGGGGGVLALIIALILLWSGVWGPSNSKDKKAAPTTTKADNKPATLVPGKGATERVKTQNLKK